jgi:LysR family transcriptional regulator, hydrogen peroxide-inducible genes activator
MEMQQVRYFLAVCEELNFTRAAEKCHVAQPSLTRAIKLLEDELGGPLFHRERGNTHLSELGNSVRPFLEEVYAQAQQAKDLAAGFAALKKTPLKLGMMCTISPFNLVGLLTSLQLSYPEIELQITDAGATMLHEMLLNGKLEAAIYCLPGEPDERLHYMPLFREQFVIAVNPGHRLAMNNAIRVRDLNGERYLNRVNCEYASHAGHIFSKQGTRVRLVYRSERDDWILAMVRAGLGFGFLPQHCVADATDIVARPLVEPEIWREVNLVTVRGRPHSPAIGALVREAMRAQWAGAQALAVQSMRAEERPDY